MIILSTFFFITAILYSSVGFGGGSTYLVLMLIWDIPYYILPIIALFCNIIVVSGNSINYIRSGNLNLKLLTPYLAGSIPFSFIGASIVIEKEIFELLLFIVLVIAGVFLLIEIKSYNKHRIKIKSEDVVAICFGYPAFIKNNKGLRNIPPPIPTIPEVNPITEPIKIDKIFGICFILIWSLLNDLLSINKNTPAITKTIKSNISNISFLIPIEAPIKAKGIDPVRYGVSNLRLRFPDLI